MARMARMARIKQPLSFFFLSVISVKSVKSVVLLFLFSVVAASLLWVIRGALSPTEVIRIAAGKSSREQSIFSCGSIVVRRPRRKREKSTKLSAPRVCGFIRLNTADLAAAFRPLRGCRPGPKPNLPQSPQLPRPVRAVPAQLTW